MFANLQGFPAKVVFAWNDEIPASIDTPKYHHKFRGSATVNFVPSAAQKSARPVDVSEL